jgi:hypothetical protein
VNFRHLVDLTTKVIKEFTTAQGGSGNCDLWKCWYREENENIEVCLLLHWIPANSVATIQGGRQMREDRDSR